MKRPKGAKSSSPWSWYSLKELSAPGDSAWHTYTWSYTQSSADSGAGFAFTCFTFGFDAECLQQMGCSPIQAHCAGGATGCVAHPA